ncbi:MAG: glycosyltransferase family 39 protein [Clostridia bacterium]
MNSYIFIFFSLLLVYDLFCVFSNKNKDEVGLNIFWSLAVITIDIIFFSTILAILGIYSLSLINLIVILHHAFLFVLLKRKRYLISVTEIVFTFKNYKFNNFVILILLICSVLYAAFPTKYMLAGRDPGLYFLNGIHIAKTGNMQYESDNYLNENYDDIKDVVELGYVGIYSAYDFDNLSDKPGDLIPQFMPMFPSALAIGYDLGGTEALNRVNGYLSIMSLLAIYYFAKRFFNTESACLAILFMAFNPAQLWGARVTETEILSQFLFFVSMYVFILGWNKNDNKLTILSGLLIGFSVMNRMDSYIFGLGVYALLTYCALLNRVKLRIAINCAAAYTISGGISFIYGILFSRPYFIDHWRNGTLSLIIYINLLFVGLSLISVIVGRIFISKKSIKNFIFEILCNKKKLFISCLILFILFLFAYFIRPLLYYGDIYNGFNSRAMVEFSWYTSFTIIPLAIFGLYSILYCGGKDKDAERMFLFLLISISSIFAYIIRPSITPDHIWAGRRWITVNIPTVFILGAYGITNLKFRKFNKRIKILLVSVVTVFMIIQSRPFMFTKIMDNIEYQHDLLARDLDDDKVYFTDNEEIASIMKFMYDKNVYYMNSSNVEGVVTYLDNHDSLYYIGNENFFNKARFELSSERRSTHIIEGKFLEKVMGKFPRKLYDRKREASVFLLTSREQNSDGSKVIEFDMENDFFQLNGKYKKGIGYYSEGKEGIVFYGPYIRLEKGKYKMVANVNLNGTDDGLMKGYFDITYNSGETMVAKKEFDKAGNVEIQFELEDAVDSLEIRLYSYKGSIISCDKVSLSKE